MSIEPFSDIRGVLFDLDGVLFVDDELIPGAVDVLRHLDSRGVRRRYLTNITTKSLDQLNQKLVSLGLPIEREEIFSSPQAAIQYLRRKGSPSCFLVLNEDTRKDFAEFPVSESDPEYVVIGDIWDRWDYPLLNRIFRMLIGGARMVALHKGRYWHADGGLQMDIGAFVAGLEYVTGTEAVVMGKPSRDFFETALQSIDLHPEDTVMVGDDIESDIGGAQRAGIRGILVRTGKYRDELVVRSTVEPDAVVDSVADLLKFF
jgi:HAD superfamily hydrolase (TIGR01458 family)